MVTKVCIHCKQEKEGQLFYTVKGRKPGNVCKKCKNKQSTASRNKEKKEANRAEFIGRSAKHTRFMRLVKITTGCVICGINSPECLDFHHVDPQQKDANPAEMSRKSLDTIKNELRKCVVICANHHRLLHAGKISI